MNSFHILSLLSVVILIQSSYALNILFVMPCLGGHFGTMSSLLTPLCSRHNCTVAELAKLCENKLKSFQQQVKFNVIKKHVMRDEYSFHGVVDFFLKFCPYSIEVYDSSYKEFSEILEESPNLYDVIITDHMVFSILILAEKFDIPVIVQVPGLTGGLEHLQDQIPIPLSDTLAFKLIFGDCWKWVDNYRAKNKLPELDYQGQFFPNEYIDRFPMFIPTSPSIYGHPHPSSEYIFIGGLRNESNFEKLDEKLEKWIISNELDIVYISLGTHSLIDSKAMMAFYEKISSQNTYRVIWSLSLGLQKTAEELHIFSSPNDKIFFSNYLPQYTLLGQSKVVVFVTHCGLGSSTDLIKRKIPSVFVPQFADQFTLAAILDRLQLGVYEKKFSFDTMNSAISKLFENYGFYAENLRKIEEELAQYESEEDIHNFVMKIAERKTVTMKTRLEYEVHSPRIYIIWRGLIFLSIFFVCTLMLTTLLCVRKCLTKKNQCDKKKE